MQLINQPQPENLKFNKHYLNSISLNKEEYNKIYGSFKIIELPLTENIINIFKSNQNIIKYFKKDKKYKINSEINIIIDNIYKLYFKNKLNKKLINSFKKNNPQILNSLNESVFDNNYKLQIILNINNKKLYNFFYKNLSENNIILNLPFLCNVLKDNENKLLNDYYLRELYYSTCFCHIYRSIKNNDIKNNKSLSNNLFVKSDYPMFFKIELNIKKKIKLLDLDPEYTIYNIKNYMYIYEPIKINIKNIEKKVFGFDNEYYGYYINGIIN